MYWESQKKQTMRSLVALSRAFKVGYTSFIKRASNRQCDTGCSEGSEMLRLIL